jgi:uncharacterized phage protein (TIGR02218 family)
MYTSSGPLAALFASGREAQIRELYTIRLASGTLLRWTSSDAAVPWGGNTWVVGPGIERGAITRQVGLEPGTMKLKLYPRAGVDVIGSTPLALALRRGEFDGAIVKFDRAYSLPGGAVVGVREGVFLGKLGEVSGDGFQYEGDVVDPLGDLEAPFPANVLQAGCLNRLFDDVCGINAASYRVTGAVTGGINPNRTTIWTALAQADDHFTLGRLRWLTGANTGRAGMIRLHKNLNGAVWFVTGWPDTVTIGDTFEAWPGCDKRQTTCSTKFSNVVHFRGAPFVPSPETTT